MSAPAYEWIDAHCHVDRLEPGALDGWVERARSAGLIQAVAVGQWREVGSFGDALSVSRARPDFFAATMGIHPHEAANAPEQDWTTLESLCALPEVRAVGEAGLDYFYDHSPREAQARAFARQCALARSVRKPLVVHVRDAHLECEEILASEQMTLGVIHCFTGDTAAARRYLDRGFYLSLSGILTYKNAVAVQDAARFAPLDRLMVETDSPYLAPIPHRGKKNEPAWVVQTGRKLAELKGVDEARVAEQTTANARALFALGPRPT